MYYFVGYLIHPFYKYIYRMDVLNSLQNNTLYFLYGKLIQCIKFRGKKYFVLFRANFRGYF